jgi:hypothetical protein
VLQFGFRDDPYLGLDGSASRRSSPASAASNSSGANLVFNGSNGLSGSTYYVLTSTNLAPAVEPVDAGGDQCLSANGNFTITVTNAVTSGAGQQFYMLQLH